MTSMPVLNLSDPNLKWMETGQWTESAVVKKKLSMLNTPTKESVTRAWKRATREMKKSEEWHQERENFSIYYTAKHGTSGRSHRAEVERYTTQFAEAIALQRFDALLEIERYLISTGQSLLQNERRYREAAGKPFSPPPIEKEEDFAFLLYLRMIPSLEKQPLDGTLEWGESLLQGGKLSERVSKVAEQALALAWELQGLKKHLKRDSRLFSFRCNQAGRCLSNHPAIGFLAARVAPVLAHLFALWKQNQEAASSPFLRELYTSLHKRGYHKRQTLLYNYLTDEKPIPEEPQGLKSYGFPWKPVGHIRFAELSPPPLDAVEQQEEVRKKASTQKGEKAAVYPMKHPPQVLAHVERAVVWTLRNLDRTSFRGEGAVGVSKNLCNLATHPALKEIFTIKTDSGSALAVEVRRKLTGPGLYGILDLDSDLHALSRHHWTALSHARLDLSTLLSTGEEPPPPKTFHIPPDLKIALWDEDRALWYIVWPAVGDLSHLELDFDTPDPEEKHDD